ncbi:hypothetical protein ACQKKK_25980 [Peribacillus sp. NPDC006672]|uniref:hypothetical protein n=1 Tax=Peribacillus sp. NPDC006672 TaxID=3390606 RepID=UPI003CFE86FD
MSEKTVINLDTIRINTIGKECGVSLSRAIRVNAHVSNRKKQGFGEQNGDGAIVLNSIQALNDSDIDDSSRRKWSI